MSTFADQARDKANEIRQRMIKAKAFISECKARVHDPAAIDALTALQADLLTIGTDCELLRVALSTATTVGEFRGRATSPHLYADAGMAAANDDTLFPDR